MTFLPIDNIGALGVIKDLLPHELPVNAWSDALNMRFQDNAIKKFPGHATFHNPALGVPWAIFPVRVQDILYFVYLSQTGAFAVLANGTDSSDITRVSGGYNMTPGVNRWNGGILNGLPFFNNFADVPQIWLSPGLATPLVDLPNWPVDYYAKIMRPFSNFLVAFDITKGGIRYPYLMKWSHSADPGTVPSSWDETNPALDAGERPLDDTGEYFIDMKVLGDQGIIYREGSTWVMKEVATTFIFSTYRLFSESGLLAQDCAQNIDEKKQFAVTGHDVILHDGVDAVSIIDARDRRAIFNEIDANHFEKSMVVPLHKEKEMWFCYPVTGGNGYLTKAAVWNWGLDTWSFKDLPSDTRSLTAGPVSLQEDDDTWDGANAWDWELENVRIWDRFTLTQFLEKVVIGVETTPEIFQAETTFQFDGVNYRSYVERTALAIARQGGQKELRVDLESVKEVQAIWPRITAAVGTEIQIYVGYQMTLNDPVTWEGPFPFRVGIDDNVQPWVSGRLIAVRFEETNGVEWEMSGFDLEGQLLGRF